MRQVWTDEMDMDNIYGNDKFSTVDESMPEMEMSLIWDGESESDDDMQDTNCLNQCLHSFVSLCTIIV